MKPTKLIKLLAITSLSLGAISPTFAADTAAKREIYNSNKGSVFGVKGILKITATVQGQVKNQEAQVWSNATNIGEGLLVAAYASISPNVGGNMPNIEITKEIEGLKLINAAGEEFDAKLVLHDEDLGLAYIALDPKGENAANWKDQVVDISKDVELQHLDETINISRYAAHFRYQSAVTQGTVSAILEKPRKLYQIINAAMSAPSFNDAGEFVGITVTKPSATKGQATPPVTIPAKYIRKLVEQATTQQAELKK
ncbi:MAG: hypothetical protein ACSHX6_13865 [Akkermansiaceae bacterium]